MVFLTGGTGVLGAHILFDLVKNGRSVRALKRENSDLSMVKKIFAFYQDDSDEIYNKIEWANGDVLDVHSLITAMKGVEKVIHAAAFVSFNPNKRSLVHQINVEGTANCVNAALENKVKRFCYVSSVAAIGRDKKETKVKEANTWQESSETSVYALTKYLGEREAFRGMAEGLNVVISNPSIMLGPGDWNRSSLRIFKTVWNGLLFYTTGITGFVDVRDVSRATIQLLDSEINGERFLISAENLPYKYVFNHIAEEMGKPKPKIKVGSFLGEFYWRFQSIKGRLTNSEPLVTKETARNANREVGYSNQKIKDALSFKFTPIQQTIKEACRFFPSN